MTFIREVILPMKAYGYVFTLPPIHNPPNTVNQ